MGDEATTAVRAEFFHDFDQRWRVVLQDAEGDELETLVLPIEADGIRSAVRLARERLRSRSLDLEELSPLDEVHDTWIARVITVEAAA